MHLTTLHASARRLSCIIRQAVETEHCSNDALTSITSVPIGAYISRELSNCCVQRKELHITAYLIHAPASAKLCYYREHTAIIPAKEQAQLG